MTKFSTYKDSLHGIQTVLRFAVSRYNVVWFFTRIYCGEPQRKSVIWYIYKGHSSTPRTSGDVCLKTSQGCFMQHKLIIKSCYTVSITILTEVTVEWLILLCSSSSYIPTLRYESQLASMWCTCCNIQHLAQQQSQQKIQCLMPQKWTICRFQWANKAYRQRAEHDDVIQWMMATAAWRQKGSEYWVPCAAYDLQWGFWQRNDEKHTF